MPEETPVQPPKKKTTKYLVSMAFMAVLIALTFYIIFKDQTIEDVFKVLKEVKLPYIGAGVLSMFMSLVVQGLIIGMAAKCIQLRMRMREMLQYSFIGFFYSAVTPSSSGGQPMQFYYMARDGVDISKTTLILFITNITYQLSVVFLGLIMIIYKWDFVAGIDKSLFILFFFGLAINFFMLLLLVGVMFSEKVLSGLLKGVVKLLGKIRIIKNPEKALAGLGKYISEVKAGVAIIKENPKRFAAISGVTLLQLLLYHFVPYFVYRAFGFAEWSWLDFVATSAIVYVSVSFLPLPGSVGASESGFVLLLRPLFHASILPGMLLSRFINFYTMLIISGVVSLYVQLRRPYEINKNKI